MSQHRQQPRWDVESREDNRENPDRSAGPPGPAPDEPDRARSTPSVAPVAYQLEEEAEDPAPTPPQAMSTFARNVIVATVGASAAFIVFGIARTLSLPMPDTTPPARVQAAPAAVENEALQDLVGEGARMSLPAAEAELIAERANARAGMSLARPVQPSPRDEPLPVVQKVSAEKSTEAALVDAAAEAATLRCLDASRSSPELRVHVHFAPEGRVASVDFEGGSAYATQTLSCVEEVFCELEIPGFGGGERTFSRALGGE